MADEHLEEPVTQTRPEGGAALSEGAVSDIGAGILGAAGWDGIKSVGRYAIDRYRIGAEPIGDSLGMLDAKGEVDELTAKADFVDLTIEGDWTRPIDFNDFDV